MTSDFTLLDSICSFDAFISDIPLPFYTRPYRLFKPHTPGWNVNPARGLEG